MFLQHPQTVTPKLRYCTATRVYIKIISQSCTELQRNTRKLNSSMWICSPETALNLPKRKCIKDQTFKELILDIDTFDINKYQLINLKN